MLVGPDGNENRHADTDFLGIEQRHALADHAGFLEPLNPAPARGHRQTDLAGDLGNRLCRIFLKKGKDLAIRRIHGCHVVGLSV